jgi:hypothetical protein
VKSETDIYKEILPISSSGNDLYIRFRYTAGNKDGVVRFTITDERGMRKGGGSWFSQRTKLENLSSILRCVVLLVMFIPRATDEYNLAIVYLVFFVPMIHEFQQINFS